MPTITSVIDKELIEDEYDLIGYHSFPLHYEDGKIRYGTYELNLYGGDIYVKEMDRDLE